MSNVDLLELERLKAAAHAKKPMDDRVIWARYHHKLQAMYERGEFVPKSHLEQSVIAEREACAELAGKIGDMHPHEDCSYYIQELITARSGAGDE